MMTTEGAMCPVFHTQLFDHYEFTVQVLTARFKFKYTAKSIALLWHLIDLLQVVVNIWCSSQWPVFI